MSWWAFTDGTGSTFTDEDRGDLARDTTGGPVEEGGSRDGATPEFNELVTDKKDIPGLPTRVVGGKAHPRRQSVNVFAGAAEVSHNIIVDSRQSIVGTAAAREAMGQQGHGTMQYDETLEPAIQTNRQFGNQYFIARKRDAQEGARNALNPAITDPNATAQAQVLGTRNARKAWLASVAALDLGSAVNRG